MDSVDAAAIGHGGKGETERSRVTAAFSLPAVDGDDPRPKYLQARDILVNAIRARKLSPGAKLPSTQAISAQIKISLITAHRALNELVEHGFVRREVGRGTFVCENVHLPRNQRKLSIALMLGRSINLDDYYHSTIISSLRRAAERDAGRIEFFFQDRYELHARADSLVGAICIHPPLDAQLEVEQLARQYPVVLLGGSFPGSRLPRIDCDNFAGARLAVQHLLQQGHRRVLVIAGPLSLSNSQDRVDGARAELTEANVQLADEDFIVSRDAVVLESSAVAHLARRLKGPNRPTAVVAGGFYLALGTMQAIHNAGLSIPKDISLVGFDDPVSAALLNPPLTTVRQPLEDMARRAYEVIFRAMNQGANGMSFDRLPAELVVRESTSPMGPDSTRPRP